MMTATATAMAMTMAKGLGCRRRWLWLWRRQWHNGGGYGNVVAKMSRRQLAFFFSDASCWIQKIHKIQVHTYIGTSINIPQQLSSQKNT